MTTKAQIETVRQNLHEAIDAAIDALLNGKDTFLEEIGQPVEEVGEYTPVFFATAPPEMDNLPAVEAMIEETKERFDLEAVPDGAKLVDGDTWERMVKTVVLAGWSAETTMQTKDAKILHITKAQRNRLEALQGIRQMMLDKDMDLDTAIAQDSVGEVEKAILTDFALKNGLQ